ncbi:hypothetical protein [Hyphomonas adhaerens]|uniref:hypothetical protein n=1 Tax=Hyphomonas adhaerens TaxID=81029 RepID=UPI002357DB3D|nr:hypothetical protein [Hyphomonas adhaerens]
MDHQKAISPEQALRRFLAVVADEADMNSGFRNRLLLSLGTPVFFEGQDDLSTVDPVELIVRYDTDTFRRIYSSLKAPALQKILRETGLASKEDMVFPKGTKAAQKVELLVNMLLDRASDRAEERGRKAP